VDGAVEEPRPTFHLLMRTILISGMRSDYFDGGGPMSSQVVIGITGSFGSGCTTVAQVLKESFGFMAYSLSNFLREDLSRRHERPLGQVTRNELGDLANKLRKQKSSTILAEETYKEVCEDENQKENLVFDSIRNPAEITFLRSKFPDFYLIAVDCVEVDRWDRVRKQYEEKGLTHIDFLRDDERDKNEDGIVYGQQVALCVDEADYLIRNDSDPMVTTKTAIRRKIAIKLQGLIVLFKGKLTRPPSESEAFMSIAYTASLLSHCLKRQVGAVIIDKKGAVVSIGYNENPKPLKPCYEQFGDCFREIYTEQIITTFEVCPFCQNELKKLTYPYRCPHCRKSLLEIIRDRARNRCTFLHAEEKAIFNAHSTDLTGCTLYLTTFPCFVCALKILDAGIESICYIEPYPDIDSIKLFETTEEKIRILRFEGAKARAFSRLFGTRRTERKAEMPISIGLEKWVDTFHTYVEEQIPQQVSKGYFEKEITKKWKEVLEEKEPNEKGLALESLVTFIFSTVNGFHPSHRIQTQTEEIDIFIRNESPDAFWSKLSPFILVECKNWSSKVGKDEIVVFRSKLENRFGLSKIGFLVSINGFHNTVTKELLRSSKGDIPIVLVDGTALKKLMFHLNRNRYLKELLGTSIAL
jgi:deoxycytidylate deaminase